MKVRSFIGDILEEPQALREAISAYPKDAVTRLVPRIESGEITRIVMAGHGSSYNALYPAFLQLSNLSIPVSLWQTAELLKYGMQQIDKKTLLVINSQSGKSIEVDHLARHIKSERPACLLAFTNYADSTLGTAADIIVPLKAGEEHGVAVKTYINPQALSLIFSVQLNGGAHEQVEKDFLAFSNEMEAFLADWEKKVEAYSELIGTCEHVIVVGRGPSTASALNGAINQKEAAWNFSEGMTASEFRHGPLELADEKLTLFITEGDAYTRSLNQALAKEVQSYGSHVIWVGNHTEENIKNINVPLAAEIAEPAAETIALQLVAYTLAKKKKIDPGNFRRIGKVVRVE